MQQTAPRTDHPDAFIECLTDCGAFPLRAGGIGQQRCARSHPNYKAIYEDCLALHLKKNQKNIRFVLPEDRLHAVVFYEDIPKSRFMLAAGIQLIAGRLPACR